MWVHLFATIINASYLSCSFFKSVSLLTIKDLLLRLFTVFFVFSDMFWRRHVCWRGKKKKGHSHSEAGRHLAATAEVWCAVVSILHNLLFSGNQIKAEACQRCCRGSAGGCLFGCDVQRCGCLLLHSTSVFSGIFLSFVWRSGLLQHPLRQSSNLQK